jgi:Mg-chelatase subunit ChlD
MNTQNAIIQGSLSAIAKAEGKSLAETFTSAEVIIICDTSGSMDQRDSKGGKSRYAVLLEELTSLQNILPGKIAVIAFSSDVSFNPAGIAHFYGGGTDLEKALKFVKVADAIKGMRFILISDGQPNSGSDALKVARGFQNHIDVIYVGPESNPEGRDFLQKLAICTGGTTVTADKAKELSAVVQKLLLTDKTTRNV